MKVTTNETVYVQKNDIAFLNSTDLPIPLSVYTKVFGDGYTFIDDSNRYDFVVYERKSEIEYFDGLDFILDYNEVKDLTDEELILFGNSIGQKVNEIAKEYNALIPVKKEKKNNKRKNHVDKRRRVRKSEIIDDSTKKKMKKLENEYSFLQYKYLSLRDYCLYKQGLLQMELPINIDNMNTDYKEVGQK